MLISPNTVISTFHNIDGLFFMDMCFHNRHTLRLDIYRFLILILHAYTKYIENILLQFS